MEIKVERWATMKFVIEEIKFALQDGSVAGRNIASPEPLNSFASGIMPFYLLDGPSYCFMCSFYRFLILVPRVICSSWPTGAWKEDKVNLEKHDLIVYVLRLRFSLLNSTLFSFRKILVL